jgi:mono/diheme cytochrome c family protein
MSRRLLLAGFAGIVVIATGAIAVSVGGESGPRSAFGDGVGHRVLDFTFRDIDRERGRLYDLLADGPVVVALRDGACPVAQKYGPELGRIAREYDARGVRFIYLNVNESESVDVARRDRDQFGLTGSYVRDGRWSVAAKLRPVSTTEVIVIDGAGTIRYRGAIDDQYGLRHTRAEPGERYLRSALDAVLEGRAVAQRSTTAEGCLLAQPEALGATERAVTWHGRVSRIVQDNCQSCHRAGGIAPMALEEYEQVRAYSAMMKFMIDAGRMPPWFAEHGVGDWVNERRIPERDRADLMAWIEAGMPAGDARQAPSPLRWAEGWNIGEPDAVLELPETFDIPAEGVVEYQYMYVKTDFAEDRWVGAFEIRPTAAQQTHHVLVFIEEPGRSFEAQPGQPAAQGGLRGYFASMAPGSVGVVYPDGMAKRLPAGAWLKFQLHYTTSGTPARDRTRLGLVFADEPPRIEVQTGSAFNTRFVIPAGAAHHEVPGEYRFDTDALIVNFFPHMHNRGAAFRYELVAPDGTAETLLEIPRYDFNWQLTYAPKQSILAPAGSTLRATGWFDNSVDNPTNPDPTQDVRFGEQTWEEMMIGYFDWIPARAAP